MPHFAGLELGGGQLLVAVSGGADSLALLEAMARAFGAARAAGGRLRRSRPARRAGPRWPWSRRGPRRTGCRFHAPSSPSRRARGWRPGRGRCDTRPCCGSSASDGLDVVLTGHTAPAIRRRRCCRAWRAARRWPGAAGIHERRADGVVRPLLFATREETHAYVRALGLEPGEGPDERGPGLPARAPPRRGAARALPRGGARGGAARWRASRRWRPRTTPGSPRRRSGPSSACRSPAALDQVALTALERPVRRRVLALFLAQAGVAVDADAIEDALSAIAEGRRGTLPGDRVLTCLEGLVEVVAAPPRAASHIFTRSRRARRREMSYNQWTFARRPPPSRSERVS